MYIARSVSIVNEQVFITLMHHLFIIPSLFIYNCFTFQCFIKFKDVIHRQQCMVDIQNNTVNGWSHWWSLVTGQLMISNPSSSKSSCGDIPSVSSTNRNAVCVFVQAGTHRSVNIQNNNYCANTMIFPHV